MLLKTEMNELSKSFYKISRLRNEICSSYFDIQDFDIYDVYKSFNKIKEILGNFNNDVSFVSCLMAKDFLQSQFDIKNFDVAEKAQSDPGLDIDVYTTDSKKIIAEIKIMVPYKGTDFGASQIDSLRNDFRKLHNTKADYKFFFVTEQSAFKVLERKYSKEFEGIFLILLGKKNLNNEIYLSQFADFTLGEALYKSHNIEEILSNAFYKAYEESFGDKENFKVIVNHIADEDDYFLQFF